MFYPQEQKTAVRAKRHPIMALVPANYAQHMKKPIFEEYPTDDLIDVLSQINGSFG